MRARGILGFGLELKKTYRRNVALGFGLSSAIIVMTAVTILLLSAPVGTGDVIAEGTPTRPPLPPPIRLEPGPGPYTQLTPPEPPQPTIGIPVPVPDNEVPDDVLHPRQVDLYLQAPGDTGEDGLMTAVGFQTEEASDDILPPPGTFVPYEEAPMPVKAVNPVYPDLARRAGVEGHVWLEVLIDREGAVRDVLEVSESNRSAGFGEAAVAAARKCIWRPAIANGQPVAVWITYKIVFKLDN
jgi:protein TonB